MVSWTTSLSSDDKFIQASTYIRYGHFYRVSKKIKTIGLAFLFAPEYMQARYILSKSCLSVRHVTLSVCHMENDRTAEKSQVIDDNERATTFIYRR